VLLSRIRAFFTGRGYPSSGPVPKELLELRGLVERLAREAPFHWWDVEPATLPSGAQILSLPPEEQVASALLAVELLPTQAYQGRYVLERLLSELLRRKLPFPDEQLTWLVETCARSGGSIPPVRPLIGVVEARASRPPLPPALEAAVRELREVCAHPRQAAEIKRLSGRLGCALGEQATSSLTPDDAWARQALHDLQSDADAARAAWSDLLAIGVTARGSKPTRKVLAAAGDALGRIGPETFQARFSTWVELVGPRHSDPGPRYETQHPIDPRMGEPNASILRGLVWASSLISSSEMARALGDLAIGCFRKLAQWGPVSAQVGNACIWALSAIEEMEAVSQLGRLSRKVKYAQAQRLIQEALAEAARRTGMSPEELEEVAVPTFGLEPPGHREEDLGGHTALLSVERTAARLQFRDSKGKVLKTVPAEVKQHHGEELKELRKTQKDLEAMLAAQSSRLEQLFLAERSWPARVWRERYLDHGLLSGLTRRLIWAFTDGQAQALGISDGGGGIVGSDGVPLPVRDETIVRLWHPLGSSADAVLGWRRFLEDREIVQPFKQAHREIYVLTDAELQTATYSNRFAGHVLRQHQFAALCRQRGWRYTLQGGFDSHNTPTLVLPRWGLEAEFWVDGHHEQAQMSPAGIYLYLATDQVRFSDATGPRPLVEVPALLFSEVMRDVDLFVGVCSIGTDPNWEDHGGGHHLDYWRHFAFGELGATAETRKAVLARLLPRLTALANVAEIDGKFLRVQGKRRGYKIHLGSGNILMEPNDQYLCIVPDRGPDVDRVFLPFEGDPGLSLILSKALLLARDDRIKDPTILRQIARS